MIYMFFYISLKMEYKTTTNLQIISKNMEEIKNKEIKNIPKQLAQITNINDELLKCVIIFNNRVNMLEEKIEDMNKEKLQRKSAYKIIRRDDDCPIMSRVKASTHSP